MIKLPISTALNSSTYTAITLGADDAFGFSVYAVDDTGAFVPFYYAVDSDGTGAVLAGESGIGWGHYEKPGETVLYAKALSGTPDLVLCPGAWVKY